MVTTYAGYALSGLIAAGIIAVGLRFLLAPARAAAGYGVPAEQAGDHAYLAVKGIRDITSGIFAIVLLAAQNPHVLASFLIAAALIPGRRHDRRAAAPKPAAHRLRHPRRNGGSAPRHRRTTAQLTTQKPGHPAPAPRCARQHGRGRTPLAPSPPHDQVSSSP